MIRVLCSIVVCILLANPFTVMTSGTLEVFINGHQVVFDQPPIILNDRTLVPFRAVFEAFGAEVGWNGETREVSGLMNDVQIKLTVDDTIAYVNDKTVILDSPAIIVKSRTLVPLRFVAENFGYLVEWQQRTRSVFITTKNLENLSVHSYIYDMVNGWYLESFLSDLDQGISKTVVFLGDSTTEYNKHSYGGSTHVGWTEDWFNENYPELVTTFNKGISGNTITDMLNRLDEDVLAYKPDLVIVCAGINDAITSKKISLADYERDYNQVIQRILGDLDCKVIIRTPNPVMTKTSDNEAIEGYNAICEKVANKYSISFFDFYSKMVDDIESGEINQLALMNDSIHPNADGQAYMFSQFREAYLAR